MRSAIFFAALALFAMAVLAEQTLMNFNEGVYEQQDAASSSIPPIINHCDDMPWTTAGDFESPPQYGGSTERPPCQKESSGIVNGNYFKFTPGGGIASVGSSWRNSANSAYTGSQYAYMSVVGTGTSSLSSMRFYVGNLDLTNADQTEFCTQGVLGGNWKPYYVSFWLSAANTGSTSATYNLDFFVNSPSDNFANLGYMRSPYTMSNLVGGWTYVTTNFYFCSFATGDVTLTIDVNCTSNCASTTAILIDNIQINRFQWWPGGGSQPSSDTLNAPPYNPYVNMHLGCFTDQGTRDLSGRSVYDITNNNPDTCSAYCAGQGFKYAAVESSDQCFCGDSYGNYGTSSGCGPIPYGYVCTKSLLASYMGDTAGNNASRPANCGGYWAEDVYLSGYLGCYADINCPYCARDLPYQISNSNTDVDSCRALCANAGYAYAAVQYSYQCFCGNSYGKAGTSTSCTMSCNGNSNQTCGGPYANNIYTSRVAPS